MESSKQSRTDCFLSNPTVHLVTNEVLKINGSNFKDKTITLAAGLDLYHLTYRNTRYNRDNLEGTIDDEVYNHLCQLPENDYIKDLKHPKYFSISYYHPLYYNNSIEKCNHAYLHYKTSKPLLLFDARRYDKVYDKKLLETLSELSETKQLDGWIYKDDPLDNWHEIHLFNPTNLVDYSHKLIIYTQEEIDRFKDLFIFPYEQEELDIIEKFQI